MRSHAVVARVGRTGGAILGLVALLVAGGPAFGGSAAADPTPRSSGSVSRALVAELGRVGGSTTVVAQRPGTPFISFVAGRPDKPLTPPSGDDASKTARAFIDRYGPAFGVSSPATALREDRRGVGRVGQVVRFSQRIDGVPVLAGELAVQVGSDGAVVSTTGKVSTAQGIDLSPTITAASAAATAVAFVSKHEGVAWSALTATVPELIVYDPSLIGAPVGQGARLVWRVGVANGDAVGRVVLVDAHDAVVALTFDALQTALSRAVCSNGDDAAKPQKCTSPVRTEGGPPATGPDAADVNAAYDTMKVFYDFMKNSFGRDSVDGMGLPLLATVLYCPPGGSCPYENAFWNGQQMVLGSGYAVADDVVGHELTHGVTQYTSKLLYYAESGAINESISDVFGELIDLSSTVSGPDPPADRWKIGEQLPRGAVRDMADPAADGQPDRMNSDYYSGSPADDYGVHRNSGVGNKAAVLIADGGTFNGQTISAIGLVKTGLIYYQAETTLLGPGSDYRDLYDILPQACRALVGSGLASADCDQVTKSVTATEMNLAPVTAGARRTAPVCDSGAYQSAVSFSADMESDTGAFARAATPASASWVYFAGSSQSGTRSLHAPDLDVVSAATATMTMPVAVPAAGTTYLRFDHSFSFDGSGQVGFDGGVVEYRVGSPGSNWLDAATLPGTINGYTSTIATGSGNVLGGRPAFSGESPGYQQTRIDLAPLAGQQVAVRFRTATDNSVAGDGWFVDDVQIYTCAPDVGGPPSSIYGPATASTPAVRLNFPGR